MVLLSAGMYAQKGNKMNQYEVATFGTGCFWCSEAIYQQLNGVKSIEVGYAGGKTANPTYEEVCTGSTGHAEVSQITFDPAKITYEKLLEVFWEAHDPTTLNRQGADVGTQYRSAIFYHDEKQKLAAEKSKSEAQKKIHDRIVTEIVAFNTFYKAEDYHQKYFQNHQNAPYCRFVIKPKLDKLKLK